MYRELKKMLFHKNSRSIYDNLRSQKNKLFSVVNVVVNKSKTSCHQVIISF